MRLLCMGHNCLLTAVNNSVFMSFDEIFSMPAGLIFVRIQYRTASELFKYTKMFFLRPRKNHYLRKFSFNLRNVFTLVPVIAWMFRRLIPFLNRLISLLYCSRYVSIDLR